MTAEPRTVAESVFRQECGRIIATLIRISGSFDRAEEAMQDAFASALASWPETGIPQNPAAWITAAAYRPWPARENRTGQTGTAALLFGEFLETRRSGSGRRIHAFAG